VKLQWHVELSVMTIVCMLVLRQTLLLQTDNDAQTTMVN